jgi:hypothetical protein
VNWLQGGGFGRDRESIKSSGGDLALVKDFSGIGGDITCITEDLSVNWLNGLVVAWIVESYLTLARKWLWAGDLAGTMERSHRLAMNWVFGWAFRRDSGDITLMMTNSLCSQGVGSDSADIACIDDDVA